MENVEVNNQKIGGDSNIKLTVNSLLKIGGVVFIILQVIAGWAYFDLRDHLTAATEISAQEKKEFFNDIDDEYQRKFENMFNDISDIKGDMKVILDRANRNNPLSPNLNVQIQPIHPPNN